MLARLLRFALGATIHEDPFIRLSFEQSASSALWSVDIALHGSTRPWHGVFYFEQGLRELLGIDVPEDYALRDGLYHMPRPLTSGAPLRVTLGASRLAAGHGLVTLRFEARGRIGGTILSNWVPMGLAAPAKLEALRDSHERRFRLWQQRHGWTRT